MVSRSGQQGVAAVAWAACVVVVLASTPAAAQPSISLSGGASVDPAQVYAGVAWESDTIAGLFRIRPGIDGGFGDDIRLGTINLDLAVRFPLGQSGWTLLQGGGPVITIVRFAGPFENVPRQVHAGASYLFGFGHDSGFLTEVRVGGGGDVPRLKLGVGWRMAFR